MAPQIKGTSIPSCLVSSVSSRDISMALLLYFLFTIVTVVGTFLIADRLHSRRLAVILAIAALVFFVALFVAILALLRGAGM
jgi:hypothetical protein